VIEPSKNYGHKSETPLLLKTSKQVDEVQSYIL